MTTATVNIALLGFGFPGGYEWIILLVLGLLIFGRRLPEVGRSLGKGIVEFKRGIKGIEDEIETESSHAPAPVESTTPEPAELPRPAVSAEPRVSRQEAAADPPASAAPPAAPPAPGAVGEPASEPDRTSG